MVTAIAAAFPGHQSSLLGKTNTPELTLQVLTDNYVYGRTNNPYAVMHTPGGSSGGAAGGVAVEAAVWGEAVWEEGKR